MKTDNFVRRVLRLACEDTALETGSCPYNCRDWQPGDCSEDCSPSIDMAKCWEAYYAAKALMESESELMEELMDTNVTTDRELVTEMVEEKREDPIEKMRKHGAVTIGTRDDYCSLNQIADEIEAVYIKLPVDADGVQIRPGESLLYGNLGIEYPIESIVLHKDGSAIARTEAGGVIACDQCRHTKHDTVEGLLEEFYSVPEATSDEVSEYAERIRNAVQNG